MFAHIQLGVHDLHRMTAFYDEVLRHIGMVRFTDLSRVGPAGVLWRHPGTRWPQFVIHHPFNGLPATAGNGSQVSFLARSHEAVDAAWRGALARGGTDAGEPGLRPRYAADFYAAYCVDPEGHKLCFVHTP
jgi:catechol 2,3-dioxygenase-like lactoylglutathione lyase family enzyme